MSLFRGTIRPSAVLSDEAIERYLASIRAGLDLDPLFRRRLRGEVMNRYVAAREGIGVAPRRRVMGRLGRAVLYASFALAATGGSVLAASQDALPGELLYPLKREVEALRVQALPEHLHDDLAAYALGERIDELGRLADLGDWDRVAAQAAVVEHDYRAFVDGAAGLDASNGRYLTVLTGLLDGLPESAYAAIQDVLAGEPGIRNGRVDGGGIGPGTGTGTNAGGAGQGAGGSGGAQNGNGGQEPRSTPDARPSRSPKPDSTPKPTKSPSADADAPDDEAGDQ